MKQPIKVTEAIFPMPVLLVATYNEDGTIDVMNAPKPPTSSPSPPPPARPTPSAY